MRKKVNISDVSGAEKKSLQLVRKLQRQAQARKRSQRVLAMTAHIGEYLKNKKMLKNLEKKGDK
jgi:hypothetical protein